ncbi:MAG: STAS domain-containing protein [Isosphaeraceae bacterium]
MAEYDPDVLFVRRVGEAKVVGFAHSYLQSEDVAAKVAAELNKLIEGKEGVKLVLTFQGVRFASSSMLAQLIKLHKAVTKAKGHMRLCCLDPSIRDVLHASQLDRMLEVYPDEAAALAKL